MRLYLLILLLFVSFLTVNCGKSKSTSNTKFDKVVWSDEFSENGAINSKRWFHQTQLPAGGSWYNGEVQHYTNSISNSFVENGSLAIVAKNERFTDQGYTKEYTSARLNSKFAFYTFSVRPIQNQRCRHLKWVSNQSLPHSYLSPISYKQDLSLSRYHHAPLYSEHQLG